MKIIVPLDEDRRSVCVSFGRTPLFLLRDTATNQTDILPNPAADAEGGAGLQAAQFVVDTDATVLITVRCGENAAKVFAAAGVEIYHAEGTDAEENLTAFQAGRLSKLTHFHAGYQGIR